MCPQMANNQKWRYQVDLYAMAMSLHLIIFGDYAKVSFETFSMEFVSFLAGKLIQKMVRNSSFPVIKFESN